jgi:hypothetical protein
LFRENDITDVLDETFSTSEDRFGEIVNIDLKPGGAEIPVTEANKKEYVNAVVEYRIHRRVQDQFEAFMEGLLDLIPADLINVFDERELELLIGGMSEIDMCVDTTIIITTHLTYLVSSCPGMTGRSSRIIVVTKRQTGVNRLSSPLIKLIVVHFISLFQ